MRPGVDTQKTIVITGGAGFLASALVKLLRERGSTRLFIPRRAEYDLTRECERCAPRGESDVGRSLGRRRPERP
jgi:nucleoside-diphosphate-sugar epimerase